MIRRGRFERHRRLPRLHGGKLALLIACLIQTALSVFSFAMLGKVTGALITQSAADVWRRSCCFWYWSVKNATVSTIGSSRSSVSPRLYQKIPRLERITHTPPAKTMPTV